MILSEKTEPEYEKRNYRHFSCNEVVFFPEAGSEKALELKDKHIKGELTLYTRDLFLYEFTSAFKNYSVEKLRKKISLWLY